MVFENSPFSVIENSPLGLFSCRLFGQEAGFEFLF